MLNQKEKIALRTDLFKYLDGLVVAPVAYVLYKNKVLAHLLKVKKVNVFALAKIFKASEGYLNVALRTLASQGWLEQHLDNAENNIEYSINNKSKAAFDHAWLYKEVYDLLQLSGKYHHRLFQKEPFEAWLKICKHFKENYKVEFSKSDETKEVQEQILKHIEGTLVAPSAVALGMSGMFHKYFMEASFKPEEFGQEPDSFSKLLDFFNHLGWFNKKNGTYGFTEKGLFYAKRASAFGVTVSYNPTFRHLDDLIFGNPSILRKVEQGQAEKHVDREMNVWGSGGAHSTYFKKVDEIIIDIFNRPIDEQPRGILDMGCGNGAYLEHLFEVIEQRTARGSMLDEHPLFLVGVDYNEIALKVTRANLIKADIWAKVIWGDIGKPALLAKQLQDDYGIALGDLLNVRTFLDHNRIWQDPKKKSKSRESQSSGAFAFRGRALSNNEVEDNLREHFEKWAPYVGKFGLLVIELHTISPTLTAQNLGKTAATAYDATHGFSDQYIVEIEVFHKVANEAGLELDTSHFYKFPDSELATVSINLLKYKN